MARSCADLVTSVTSVRIYRAVARTVFGVWTRAHDGHRVAAIVGRGEAKALSDSALCEVLGGTVDLYMLSLAGVRTLSTNGSRGTPSSVGPTLTAPNPRMAGDVPSNWEAKAFASSRLTVELAPVPELLPKCV